LNSVRSETLREGREKEEELKKSCWRKGNKVHFFWRERKKRERERELRHFWLWGGEKRGCRGEEGLSD
jgi:hypothetical protein